MNRLNKGFTLVELMIVIVVIGIIATFSVYAWSNNSKKAKIAEGVAQIQSIAGEVEAFRLKNGFYKNSTSTPSLEDILINRPILYNNTAVYTVSGLTFPDGKRYEVEITRVGNWLKNSESGCKITIDGTGNLIKSVCL